MWVFATRSTAAQSFARLWIAFGAIFLVTAIVMGGLPALIALPQWILLLPTGLLALFAARND